MKSHKQTPRGPTICYNF